MPLEISRRRLLGTAGAALLAAHAPGSLRAQPGRTRGSPKAGPFDAGRELMVPVEGGRIYVRINGELNGPRPPVLMIHGGPGSAHANFLNALPLADERAVILYDQLDSGRSDAPNDPANWRVPRFVAEVEAIRRALGVSRWHVLGGSWGGTIALEYGARRPAGLASLVLQSPLVSTRSWLADANALRRLLPGETQRMLTACEGRRPPPAGQCGAATDAFNARFLRRVPLTREQQAYRAALPTPFNTRIYEAMWGKTEFVSTGTLRNYDGEPLLARLDARRLLWVTGQHDEARPATVHDFAARTPGSSFAVIEDAAHAIFNDNPEGYIALLRRWFRRNDAA
jgi:proline iminopeptidase/L-proline amide hydrolase